MPRDKDVKKQRWEGIETRKKSRNVINVGFIEVAANLAATRRVKKKTPGTWLARGKLWCEICNMLCKKARKRKYCERGTGICVQLPLFQFGYFIEHIRPPLTSPPRTKGRARLSLASNIYLPQLGVLWSAFFGEGSFISKALWITFNLTSYSRLIRRNFSYCPFSVAMWWILTLVEQFSGNFGKDIPKVTFQDPF